MRKIIDANTGIEADNCAHLMSLLSEECERLRATIQKTISLLTDKDEDGDEIYRTMPEEVCEAVCELRKAVEHRYYVERET